MFDPKKFTTTKARPIPVYLLLDVSGSMKGDKINTLNSAVEEMLAAFAKEEQIETLIEVCVITFGGDTATTFISPTRAAAIEWIPLSAEGLTPLGSALTLAKGMIEDKSITPSNAYRPTIVLVSDGEPNDQWQLPLQEFTEQGRTAKCDRMAMAIGSKADEAVLNLFIKGTQHKLFAAGDAAQLHTFFQRLTMTVGARTRSQNPNDVPDPAQFRVDDRVSKSVARSTHGSTQAAVAAPTQADNSDPW
jgi:uncharacterized protein YegL